jgi:hypothetical protein
MTWSVTMGMALALGASIAGIGTASAQMTQAPSPCDGFLPLRNDAQQKANAIAAAQKRHATPKELCVVVTRFTAAEGAALKFLETNKTWCGIPDAAVSGAKENHAKTMKFREMVCNAQAAPVHIPALSDSISTPALDTAKNTKTGSGGTFDTLTGNPLAR